MSPAPAAGDVDAIVRSALSAATASGRTLVVYVGATWCEPCQHFHRAVEEGELAAALAGVTFLEFDLDRDRDRLVTAGYRSAYIPLFALPREDGRASGRQVEGGIKGDGAVGFMLPRLQGLLER
jgi:thiol-disulfide isomerase/thioredoxin